MKVPYYFLSTEPEKTLTLGNNSRRGNNKYISLFTTFLQQAIDYHYILLKWKLDSACFESYHHCSLLAFWRE